MNKLCIISFIAINEYSLAFKGFHIFVIPVLCPDLLLLLLRFRVGYVANTISNWIGTNCKMCKKNLFGTFSFPRVFIYKKVLH